MDAGSGLMVVVVLLGFALAVVWVLMPLAVVGIKPLLRRQIAAQERTNLLLEQLRARMPSRVND